MRELPVASEVGQADFVQWNFSLERIFCKPKIENKENLLEWSSDLLYSIFQLVL